MNFGLNFLNNLLQIYRTLILVLCLFSVETIRAKNVPEGFAALNIYDYFLAKKTFQTIDRKSPDAYACYGLSLIYGRNDNPFHNLDSAAFYIHKSFNLYKIKQQKKTFSGFVIDSTTIRNQAHVIALQMQQRLFKNISIDGCEHFLMTNYLTNETLRKEIIFLRDELEFNQITAANSSQITEGFIVTHPQSSFFIRAQQLLQRQIYEEQTKNHSSEEYILFLGKYPGHPFTASALENLYQIYKEKKDIRGLDFFVKNYPEAAQLNDAWKLLFSFSVRSFSNSELEMFLQNYPSFPFKNTILRDMELNKLELFVFEKEDLFGYCDTLGMPKIIPQYESASAFYEGLALVTKNDSTYFINKDGKEVFNRYFSDAQHFSNGLAPVKINDKWNFINRSGQNVGRSYEEISDLRDGIYVVKNNGLYGALNSSGEIVVDCQFQKLGDFSNGYAYFTREGRYGFISASGVTIDADLDWISDFNKEGFAVYKKNNAFGIIAKSGEINLKADFDLIQHSRGSVFIVVKNGKYGFYDTRGCFIHDLLYEYAKEKPESYYFDGSFFKLIKTKGQSLTDKNGHLLLEFGAYEEVHFAHNGLHRVKRKDKFGYLDSKMNLIIPVRYSTANDFKDSIAIAQLKDKYVLLSRSGKEIYSSDLPLKKLSRNFYSTGEENDIVIDKNGIQFLSGIQLIQSPSPGVFLFQLKNGEIKFLRD